MDLRHDKIKRFSCGERDGRQRQWFLVVLRRPSKNQRSLTLLISRYKFDYYSVQSFVVNCLLVRMRQSRCIVIRLRAHNTGGLVGGVSLERFKHWLRFRLERLLMRGLPYRLLLVAITIVAVSILAGVVVFALTRSFTIPGAIWWAFLRLTDPGYLGDDQGLTQRTVSTIVTIFGYVFFLGALIAILTQWLNQSIDRLELGVTPIALRNHILILGWTNLTPILVQCILRERQEVEAFLEREDIPRLRIVILAENVSAKLRQELQTRLGSLWNKQEILLRSGSPLILDDLRRVNFQHARVIVSPGYATGAGDEETFDNNTVKALLSISKHPAASAQLPRAAIAVSHASRVAIVKRAYNGSSTVLSGEQLIAGEIVQTVRHPGISAVYNVMQLRELRLAVYPCSFPELIGQRLRPAYRLFPKAILLGAVRGCTGQPILNPSDAYIISDDDQLLLLASSRADCELDWSVPDTDDAPVINMPRRTQQPKTRRVLILGWNQHAPAILHEFGSYEREHFLIDIVSTMPAEERQKQCDLYGPLPPRVTVHHLTDDYTVPSVMAALDPGSYDNVLLLANQWMAERGEADARSIVAALLLEDLLTNRAAPPGVLVELMDPENLALLPPICTDAMVTPFYVCNRLAQITLQPELTTFIDALLSAGETDMSLRPAAFYELNGRTLRFADVQLAAYRRGEIAIGLLRTTAAGPELEINPQRDHRVEVGTEDQIIVFTNDLTS